MANLHQIGMMWMHGSLSFLEQLCVKSFVDAGHHTILYTYEEVGQVPQGVELRNAADILPEVGVVVHERTGSPAPHADQFRYHMLRCNERIIWADTDAYCRKPFLTEDGHFFGWESKKHINNGVLGLPQDSEALHLLIEHCSDKYSIPTWYGEDYAKELEQKKAAGNPVHAGEQPWGVWGPHALTHFLHKTGEDRFALPQEALYPFSFRDRRKIVKPKVRASDYVTERTRSIHLYGRRMRKFVAERFGGVPDPSGLLGQLLIKHRVNPLEAPLRDCPNPDPDSLFAKAFREEINGKQYLSATPASENPAPLNSVVAVTTMKNEGPYIIDWVAYHLWLGFTHFLVYTNDCSDGTDQILDRLAERGLVTRIDNPARIDKGERPQRVALSLAESHPVVQSADAYMVFDVDEYIDIHTKEGTLRSLMDATGNPELVSMTWRFFGCSGVADFVDEPVPMQFDCCAPRLVRFPHHNWGFKTFVRMPSTYSRLGVHRPLEPVNEEMPRWVNGSGEQMPDRYWQKGWRSSLSSWGYSLVTLNHYSIRSLDSYLVKRDRGRTNHINREQGIEYWNVHNRNDQQDRSIQPHFEKSVAVRDDLISDPRIANLHVASCNWHRARINGLKDQPEYKKLYQCLSRDILSHGVPDNERPNSVSLPKLRLTGPAFEIDAKVASAQTTKSEDETSELASFSLTRAERTGHTAQEAYERLRKRVVNELPLLTPIDPLSRERITIVSTMCDEAPFLLEWIAYHRSIGVTDFLIYTNDCTDGTDALLDRLQALGYVTRVDNPCPAHKPEKLQRRALNHAINHPLIDSSDWYVCMNCDEFINVHVGEGTLSELFVAMNEPNLVSMTWKLFGNAGIARFEDGWMTENFDRCAPQFLARPGQNWGFKTLVHKSAPYGKIGVHRPLNPDHDRLSEVRWVNGSGREMPEQVHTTNSWRSTKRSLGYDLVTLNHYTLRSADSYLVKCDRGRVNHVDEDMGGYYWDRRNYNSERDDRIQQRVPRARAELERIMADPEVAALHRSAVESHKRKVAELKALPEYARLYQKISAPNQPDAIFMPERSAAEVAD